MTFFPEASSAQQSLLMTALLAVLIFDIFSLFTAFSNEKRRLYGLIDSGLFLLLFVTLTVLANSFYKIHEENSRGILFPLPMWLLWCVTGAAFVFLIIENIVRYRGRNERLDSGCVKQAMDMLPCAVRRCQTVQFANAPPFPLHGAERTSNHGRPRAGSRRMR